MKDYPYVPGWRLNKDNNKPAINRSVLMLSKHGVSEGEWDGNEWIQYRWSGKLKNSDVLYWIYLEDLTQLEKEGDSLQQEQQEAALFERPETPIKDAIEVTSRMQYIDEELKPIAEFIIDYASWNLHSDEWNHPVIEVPLFRVLDALAQRGKSYCGFFNLKK